MKDVGVRLHKLACAVAVMGIGVQDRETVKQIQVPEVLNGQHDVIEAARAPEEGSTGMMPSGPDEGEGVPDLSPGDGFARQDHSARGPAAGRAQGVPVDLPDELGRVDSEEEIFGNHGGFEQPETGIPEQGFDDPREMPEARALGKVASSAEAGMIKNARDIS